MSEDLPLTVTVAGIVCERAQQRATYRGHSAGLTIEVKASPAGPWFLATCSLDATAEPICKVYALSMTDAAGLLTRALADVRDAIATLPGLPPPPPWPPGTPVPPEQARRFMCPEHDTTAGEAGEKGSA